MQSPSTRYLNTLLCILYELVPDLTYREYVAPDTDDCDILYIFGVHRNHQIAGGYACTFTKGTSNLVDDGVAITRFFLKAMNAAEAVYDPPELRELWEHDYLREIMFLENNL